MGDYDEGYGSDDDRQENHYLGGQVKTFVVDLANALLDSRDDFEISQLYAEEYNNITESQFKNTPWPSADTVAPVVNDDENFLLLYQELYYRHVYAKLKPTVDHRFESFQNYTSLFNTILGLTAEDPELVLPSNWMWDIIDEFTYQFRDFHQYRTNVDELRSNKRGGLQLLKDHPHVWSAQSVIRYLHALVRKANIDITSSRSREERMASNDGDVAPMFRTLGEFSLIGLCRVMCILSDYTSALQVIELIDLNDSRSAFAQNTPARVSLSYYRAFAYFMTRRYTDAINTCCDLLNWINRNKNAIPRSYQTTLVNKKVDATWGLLALALAFSNQGLDESFRNQLQERFGDKMRRLESGDANTVAEFFDEHSPKFISTSPPDYEGNSAHRQALSLQRKILLKELKQRDNSAAIYGFLKMCTSISKAKLANFLKMDEETLETHLLNIKHKTRNRTNNGREPALDGEFKVNGEVDFFVNGDMVHMSEHVRPKRYSEHLVSEILKMDNLTDYLRSTPVLRP
jgi:translation initiation factor 3 subunit L